MPWYISSLTLPPFGIVGIIANKTGRESMDDYDGLYRTNPGLSIAMMLAISRWREYLRWPASFRKVLPVPLPLLEKGFYVLVTIAVLNTIIATLFITFWWSRPCY